MAPDTAIDPIRAEAAAWLARLRSDAAAPEDRAGFQAWLAEDTRHAEAFEAITAAWDLVGGLSMARPMRPYVVPTSNRRAILLGGVALAAAGAFGLAYWPRPEPEVYATALGEQRRLLLPDGSQIFLDTETKLSVRFLTDRREIILDHGRAFFDVAPNPHRPFAVTAGDHEVVALGTAFEVELGSGFTSATLDHGQIVVSSDSTNSHDYLLAPGDRIRLGADGAVVRDRPDLALALAWRSGRLGFDQEPLAAAIAELNRYSQQHLVIADPKIAGLKISGLYTAGDNEAFARSLAVLLPVAANIGPAEIVLTPARLKNLRRSR